MRQPCRLTLLNIFLCIVFSGIYLYAEPEEVNTGNFRWGFFSESVIHQEDEKDMAAAEPLLIPLDMRFFIQPIDNAYIYVILRDDKDNIRILFPKAFSNFPGPGMDFSKRYIMEKILVPETGDWQMFLRVLCKYSWIGRKNYS